MCDDACCYFSGQYIQTQISHIGWRIGRCAMPSDAKAYNGFSINGISISCLQLTPVFDKPAFSRFSQIFQPRLVVRSFGKIVKRQVLSKTGVSCVVIFWPRDTKPDIAHRQARRIGRCAMMHVVICFGQAIQNPISHIDRRIESVDVR